MNTIYFDALTPEAVRQAAEIILHVWMPVQTLQRMWGQMC